MSGLEPDSAQPEHPAFGPLRLIEPFGAGGGPDWVARALAERLSERSRRRVDVENHPGAGSTAAPELVAKSPADGSVLLINTSAHVYAAAASHLPYDPLRDFVAVTPLTSQAYVVVVGQPAAVSSLAELVRAAKDRPGVTFGTTGVGTATHLGTLELNLAARIRARHVPAGPDDAISDVVSNVIAGAIDYAMVPITIAAAHLADESLIALGVTSAQRSTAVPNVPTLAEAGAPDYEFPIWYGVWAPAGMPLELADRLATDIAWAITRPDVHERLVKHGMEPMKMTREAFGRFVIGEAERAERIVNASGRAQR